MQVKTPMHRQHLDRYPNPRAPLPLYYINHHEPLTSGVINAPILKYPKIAEPTLLGLQERIRRRKLSKNWEKRQFFMSRIDKKDYYLEVSP
jgi:hypothetical protein